MHHDGPWQPWQPLPCMAALPALITVHPRIDAGNGEWQSSSRPVGGEHIMWKLVLALALSRAAHALRPAPPTMVARPVRVGDTLHVTVPPMVSIVSALMRQGYRVSRSHTDPCAIKTDAPNRQLWDVMRCWANSQPKRAQGLSETSPATAILAQAPPVQADFTPTKEAQELLSKKSEGGARLGRFMPNPDEWGPGSRHTSHADAFAGSSDAAPAAADEPAGGSAAAGHQHGGAMLDKRAANQGKKKARKRAREAAAAAEGAGEEEEEAAGEEGEGPK